MATPNAIPSMFTVRMHALRILKKRNRFPSIVDAIDPGGSGDPYAELNDEERAALSEVTRMGYTLRGWRSEEHTSELQSLMLLSPAVFCLNTNNTSNHSITYT